MPLRDMAVSVALLICFCERQLVDGTNGQKKAAFYTGWARQSPDDLRASEEQNGLVSLRKLQWSARKTGHCRDQNPAWAMETMPAVKSRRMAFTLRHESQIKAAAMISNSFSPLAIPPRIIIAGPVAYHRGRLSPI